MTEELLVRNSFRCIELRGWDCLHERVWPGSSGTVRCDHRANHTNDIS